MQRLLFLVGHACLLRSLTALAFGNFSYRMDLDSLPQLHVGSLWSPLSGLSAAEFLDFEDNPAIVSHWDTVIVRKSQDLVVVKHLQTTSNFFQHPPIPRMHAPRA